MCDDIIRVLCIQQNENIVIGLLNSESHLSSGCDAETFTELIITSPVVYSNHFIYFKYAYILNKLSS